MCAAIFCLYFLMAIYIICGICSALEIRQSIYEFVNCADEQYSPYGRDTTMTVCSGDPHCKTLGLTWENGGQLLALNTTDVTCQYLKNIAQVNWIMMIKLNPDDPSLLPNYQVLNTSLSFSGASAQCGALSGRLAMCTTTKKCQHLRNTVQQYVAANPGLVDPAFLWVSALYYLPFSSWGWYLPSGDLIPMDMDPDDWYTGAVPVPDTAMGMLMVAGGVDEASNVGLYIEADTSVIAGAVCEYL